MIIVPKNCTGCGTCELICPIKCIKMQSNTEGFFYPIVNELSCIQCKKCERVCPVLNKMCVVEKTYAYAAKHRMLTTRMQSSSGGVFASLAKFVIAQNGYVCAAIYNMDFEVAHVVSGENSQIEKMQGAKYVQSKSWHCFTKLKEYLQSEKWVLFVGTPCQVAGFKAYLGREYEKLITVDMICHGVPSEKVWKAYLNQRKKIDVKKGELQKINLRSKKSGWSRYRYSVEFLYSDGYVYNKVQNEDLYMKGFVENLFLRKSCAACEFKGIERISDITLGDYWGVWNQYPEFDDNRGVSLVLVHSEKGRTIWNNIKCELEYRDVPLEEAISENPSAVKSSVEHYRREEFFEKLEYTKNVQELIAHCLDPLENKNEAMQKKVKRFLKRLRKQ